MSKVAVYKRVSTDKQDLAMQNHAVDEWLAKQDFGNILEFADEGISGKTTNRPGFQAMLAAIEAGEVGTVVVYRLDRLTRNAVIAMQMIINWMQRGIDFFVVDQPALNATKDDPFRLTKYAMFSELAQIEREATVSRVKAGLAAAKARGVKLGASPKLTLSQRQQIATAIAAGRTYRDVAKELGVSASTVYRAAKS